MLINSNLILGKALKEGYAVPAYNINNLEWTRFILEACNEDKSPVILGITPKTVQYFGGYKLVVALVRNMIKELKINIPVVLHLDHASSFEECKSAIDAGFTSVMIDVSDRLLEENIRITSLVVDYAKEKNVSVEAELGDFGSDDITYSNYLYARLDECKNFVIDTSIDSLAACIGNKHGIYDGSESLDFNLLGAICKEVKIPLVLHGASGLDENKIKTSVFCGVAKVNINTDLQVAWATAVRKYLDYDKDVYDPRKIIKSGEKELKKIIHEKNNILGCKNKI